MANTLLLFAGLVFVAVCSGCPSGWIKFQTDCYWVDHSRKLNWGDAKNACIKMNSFLVKVYSDEENSFIQGELRKLHPGGTNTDQFWTAGNDIHKEREFVWAGLNDRITDYTDWAPGEPNQNGGEEDCIAFFPYLGYHWNDEHCDRLEHFICQQPDQTAGGIVG